MTSKDTKQQCLGCLGQLTFQLLAQQLPLLVELRLQLLQSCLGLRQLQLQGLFQQRDLVREREREAERRTYNYRCSRSGVH